MVATWRVEYASMAARQERTQGGPHTRFRSLVFSTLPGRDCVAQSWPSGPVLTPIHSGVSEAASTTDEHAVTVTPLSRPTTLVVPSCSRSIT